MLRNKTKISGDKSRSKVKTVHNSVPETIQAPNRVPFDIWNSRKFAPHVTVPLFAIYNRLDRLPFSRFGGRKTKAFVSLACYYFHDACQKHFRDSSIAKRKRKHLFLILHSFSPICVYLRHFPPLYDRGRNKTAKLGNKKIRAIEFPRFSFLPLFFAPNSEIRK